MLCPVISPTASYKVHCGFSEPFRVRLEAGGCESPRCRAAKTLFSITPNGFRAAYLDLATLSSQKQSEISFARISHTSREEGRETDLKHSIVRRKIDAHRIGLFRLVSWGLMMMKKRKKKRVGSGVIAGWLSK